MLTFKKDFLGVKNDLEDSVVTMYIGPLCSTLETMNSFSQVR